MSLVPSVGLYRHFKGKYYYVTGCSRSAVDESTILVNYFDVCHPEYGSFSRPVDDFMTDQEAPEKYGGKKIHYIKDRVDNITGQHHRFERVRDLNYQLGSISTSQLIDELVKRTDSPIHELDLDELGSKIDCRDYVIGIPYQGENYVIAINTFDNELQANRYLATHKINSDTHLYKRIFIRVK